MNYNKKEQIWEFGYKMHMTCDYHEGFRFELCEVLKVTGSSMRSCVLTEEEQLPPRRSAIALL